MTIRIDNEWGTLQRVIVGDGHEMGPPTTADTAFDPTSYSHLKAGTYPDPDRVAVQLAHLFDILADEGVEVMNPDPIPGLEQVFARDVGLVIEDRFYRSVMIGDNEKDVEAGHNAGCHAYRFESDNLAPLARHILQQHFKG